MTLKFSPPFSDNAVLQRNKAIIFRGKAKPGANVKLAFHNREFETAADKNGEWQVNAGEYRESRVPLTLTAYSESETASVNNLLIGDVWLCSGQSNMEFTLGGARYNYPGELGGYDNFIRQVFIPQNYNFKEAEKTLPDCCWNVFSPETAPDFTAVGYFFAKNLRERYNVPIGLIAAAVGGVPIAAFMSRDMLKDFPDDLAEADKCADSDYVSRTIGEYAAYEQDYADRLDAADDGLKQGWHKADYDDSDWEEADLFAPVSGSGAHWYRKTIDLPQSASGEAALFLGTAIDMDVVYVNGVKIGETFHRYAPREYYFRLPDCQKLSVAVRLQCYEGGGGFTSGKNCFLAAAKQTVDLVGNWKRRTGVLFENREKQTFFQYKPTGLFNGMIMPLTGYPISGVIWYQGESDAWTPTRYAEKTRQLINGWRELRGDNTLPFLMTQLAYWEEGDWDLLRRQQKLCLDLPNTGLAAAYDLGECNDLHPLNKRDIGERLARLAARIAYGEDLPVNPFEMYRCQ